MKRIATLLTFLFLFFLASCGAAEPDTAVTPATDSALSTANQSEVPAFTPATNAAEAAQLRPDDHTHGATAPAVTIIEYGDFQ